MTEEGRPLPPMTENTPPRLEEVFKLSGIPEFTFVRPIHYRKLLVSLRTPGRGVVVEGPSGIGKTTAITKALADTGLEPLRLSARKKEDVDLIKELPRIADPGVVVIDDFHRLSESVRRQLADYMKTLADEEDANAKLIVIGINQAGDALVQFAPDLNARIDTIRFEREPEASVRQLIEQGQTALNIRTLRHKEDIVDAAHGSFYIAQLLCHESCVIAGHMEASHMPRVMGSSLHTLVASVMENLDRRFGETARRFAAGPKLRREGRAPYLHILHWLGDSDAWSINVNQEMARHKEQRASVGQVVTKGNLERFLDNDKEFAQVLHFDPMTSILSAEDPQFVFFLRHLSWNKFAQDVGFLRSQFKETYDIALSFAGEERVYADALFGLLCDRELAVFYDKNEQFRILALDVEEYLGPIYRSEARFVVPLLSRNFPKKIWTKFESGQFRARFNDGSVIPMWFADAPFGMFDESRSVGGVSFDPDAPDYFDRLVEIADLLAQRVALTEDDGDLTEDAT